LSGHSKGESAEGEANEKRKSVGGGSGRKNFGFGLGRGRHAQSKIDGNGLRTGERLGAGNRVGGVKKLIAQADGRAGSIAAGKKAEKGLSNIQTNRHGKKRD